ncbi:MAG: ethanolamine utilization acetate kinase EutQ [Halioglobus sp.]|nr:ethanolamine utilization acetate kinase EutQ [Halioglobus sp.]
MKLLITAEEVKKRHRNGNAAISFVLHNTIITPEARDVAKKLGMVFTELGEPTAKSPGDENAMRSIVRKAVEARLSPGSHDPAAIDRAIATAMRELRQPVPHCDRERAGNGVVLVRGSSVEFGRFDGVCDHNVGLTDIITAADNSTMAAGYMQWEKCSFPWTLTYDEIDIVLEGELHIVCAGRTFVGKPGDVFFIPKGTTIEFSAPDKVRFVYVTYPANWADSGKA